MHLHDYILQEICEFIQPNDLMSFKLVNKKLNQIMRSNRKYLFVNELDYWCNIFINNNANSKINLKITHKKYQDHTDFGESLCVCSVFHNTFDFDVVDLLKTLNEYDSNTIIVVTMAMKNYLLINTTKPLQEEEFHTILKSFFEYLVCVSVNHCCVMSTIIFGIHYPIVKSERIFQTIKC